jgi:hypothetical protein
LAKNRDYAQNPLRSGQTSLRKRPENSPSDSLKQRYNRPS